MGRWGNFLGRKTPALAIEPREQPSEARDELGDLHLACDMRRCEIAALEAEVRQCDAELAEADRLASDLKVAASENNGDATARLDELDRQELSIRRRRDGLV